MNLPIRLLFTVAMLAATAAAQQADDLPPNLTWDQLKGNCPDSLDWASLRGKVVVISIRKTIPGDIADWKRLTETFPGRPAIFLLVYSGSEFLLDQEMVHNSFSGCVLLDGKMASRQGFGISQDLDSTVVINDRGFIAGFDLTGGLEKVEPAVGALLKNEPASGLLATARRTPRPSPYAASETVPAPSYAVQIALSEKDELRFSMMGSGKYVSRNFPLNVVISELWDTPGARISFPENLDDRGYDILANMPVNDEALVRTLLQEAVEKYFGLHIGKETRTVRAYTMTAARPSPQLQPAKDGEAEVSSSGPGFLSAVGEDMQEIASAFQDLLEAPVMDKTGLEGKYDYWVSSKVVSSQTASSRIEDAQSVMDMAHQLGLELIETDQSIEMLVVQKLW